MAQKTDIFLSQLSPGNLTLDQVTVSGQILWYYTDKSMLSKCTMTFGVRCNTFSITHWKIPGADEALKGKWV